MSRLEDQAQDSRALAQERILDALLRALAIEQPGLLDRMRSILVDTEFTHTGKPRLDETVHQQIQSRIGHASQFAAAHGSPKA
jgi:hypothetical protein